MGADGASLAALGLSRNDPDSRRGDGIDGDLGMGLFGLLIMVVGRDDPRQVPASFRRRRVWFERPRAGAVLLAGADSRPDRDRRLGGWPGRRRDRMARHEISRDAGRKAGAG